MQWTSGDDSTTTKYGRHRYLGVVKGQPTADSQWIPGTSYIGIEGSPAIWIGPHFRPNVFLYYSVCYPREECVCVSAWKVGAAIYYNGISSGGSSGVEGFGGLSPPPLPS